MLKNSYYYCFYLCFDHLNFFKAKLDFYYFDKSHKYVEFEMIVADCLKIISKQIFQYFMFII